MIAMECTLTQRDTSSVKMKRLGSISMLPSNTSPTTSPASFTTGLPELPPMMSAVDTKFMGASERQGVWAERCQGCGSCILARTGGICPVSRCAKRLFNGPCGGSTAGRCEIATDVPCAWQLIIDRLKALGRLDDYEDISPIKDWSTDRAGGPRKVVREDVQL